jgi:hypothetical protein
LLSKTGVGVEKLAVQKFVEIASRQDAIQATFSVRLDIFYPPNPPDSEISSFSTATGVYTSNPVTGEIAVYRQESSPAALIDGRTSLATLRISAQ